MAIFSIFSVLVACCDATSERWSLISDRGSDCTVTFEEITPSETGSGKDAASKDKPHLVFAGTITEDEPLRVYMPGTGGHPIEGELINSITKCSKPTIGLSYQSHPSPDAARVELCKNQYGDDMPRRAKCNSDQHADCVWGGSSQPELWPNVSAENSIVGRLQLLLSYLDKKYPEQGWSTYLDGIKKVRWDRIVMGGHSQGGSHAAWMAQNMSLHGVVMLSGPQDDYEIPAYWVDAPFSTSRVVGACHSRESDAVGIRANWARFNATALGWANGGKPLDLGDGLSPIPYGPIVSNLQCCEVVGRPCHMSMGDPCVQHNGTALYALHLWPELFDHASSFDPLVRMIHYE